MRVHRKANWTKLSERGVGVDKKKLILLVDDTESNTDVLIEILGDDYDIAVATDGPTAIEVALQEHPDLIILDVMMPGMDGHEVCRRLKSNKWTTDAPVIFVTTLGEVEDEEKGLSLGAVDYLVKPVNPAITRARVSTHLSLKSAKDELARQNDILERRVIERTKELQLTQDVTIEALAGLAETRDNETGYHIRRTQHYVRCLAVELRRRGLHIDLLTEAYIKLLFKSAPLHDIGKVGVPDAILLKPGKLTDKEWIEMRKHTTYGYEALRRAEETLGTSSFLSMAKEIALTHHERWDGGGYPHALRGDDIPICGRIMAVADVYDALISKRVYKPASIHEKAVDIISGDSGLAFDPDVAGAFEAVSDAFQTTAQELSDDGGA